MQIKNRYIKKNENVSFIIESDAKRYIQIYIKNNRYAKSDRFNYLFAFDLELAKDKLEYDIILKILKSDLELNVIGDYLFKKDYISQFSLSYFQRY